MARFEENLYSGRVERGTTTGKSSKKKVKKRFQPIPVGGVASKLTSRLGRRSQASAARNEEKRDDLSVQRGIGEDEIVVSKREFENMKRELENFKRMPQKKKESKDTVTILSMHFCS